MVLVAGLFTASPTFAHVGHNVHHAERYLKLELEESRLRVVLTMTLGTSAMFGALQRADENRDGNVSRDESESYLSAWTESLADALPLYIDGQRVPLNWESPYMAPIGAVMPIEGAVEAVAYVPMGSPMFSREHLVVLEDRMTMLQFDRTDVRFIDASGEARVVAAGFTSDISTTPMSPFEEDTLDIAFEHDEQHFVAMAIVFPMNRWIPLGVGMFIAFVAMVFILRRKTRPAD